MVINACLRTWCKTTAYPRSVLLVEEILKQIVHHLEAAGCVDVVETLLAQRRSFLTPHRSLLHERGAELEEMGHGAVGEIQNAHLNAHTNDK